MVSGVYLSGETSDCWDAVAGGASSVSFDAASQHFADLADPACLPGCSVRDAPGICIEVLLA